jgi:hypothetical protein
VKNLLEGLESCSANYCNVQVFNYHDVFGKLVKIFSYLCIALFGTVDGNMVPLNFLLLGTDPVHNQPNMIFYCLESVHE